MHVRLHNMPLHKNVQKIWTKLGELKNRFPPCKEEEYNNNRIRLELPPWQGPMRPPDSPARRGVDSRADMASGVSRIRLRGPQLWPRVTPLWPRGTCMACSSSWPCRPSSRGRSLSLLSAARALSLSTLPSPWQNLPISPLENASLQISHLSRRIIARQRRRVGSAAFGTFLRAILLQIRHHSAGN